MATEGQPVTDAPKEIQADRLPFDVEFFKKAHEFCNNAMQTVPELQGVAIIPLWHPAPENTPAGLLRLRNPQPPYLASLLMLMRQVSLFSTEAHRDMVAQLRMFDSYAAELAAQIKAKKEELDALTGNEEKPNE